MYLWYSCSIIVHDVLPISVTTTVPANSNRTPIVTDNELNWWPTRLTPHHFTRDFVSRPVKSGSRHLQLWSPPPSPSSTRYIRFHYTPHNKCMEATEWPPIYFVWAGVVTQQNPRSKSIKAGCISKLHEAWYSATPYSTSMNTADFTCVGPFLWLWS